jgi:hypothetical protein
MRHLLLSVVLMLVAASSANATEALIFDGGGYNVYVLVGVTDNPTIAEVRVTPPGAKDWIGVPRDLLQIKKFNMKDRVLEMSFANKNSPDLPPSFSLSVKKNKAVLTVDGKRIKSSFDWLQ